MAELETEIPNGSGSQYADDDLPPNDEFLHRNGRAENANSWASMAGSNDHPPDLSQPPKKKLNALPSLDTFMSRQKPRTTLASIVDHDEPQHPSASRCESEGIPKSVSWADELEVHHDGPSQEAGESVFQFNGDAADRPTDLVQSLLDNMRKSMGLSPLADDVLCLHRHDLFSK